MTVLDWLWLTLAALLGLAGAALTLWSLFWDRPRGRPRCPKCWYDLTPPPAVPPAPAPAAPNRNRDRKGAESASVPKCGSRPTPTLPITCPECGRQTRRPRRFRKTHRRWRWAAAGVLLILLGAAAAFGHRVYRDGLIKATPSIAYIAALPWLAPNGGHAELDDRVARGKLSRWECRRLIDRALGIMEREESPEAISRAIETLGSLEYSARQAPARAPWGTWAAPTKEQPERAFRCSHACCGTKTGACARRR